VKPGAAKTEREARATRFPNGDHAAHGSFVAAMRQPSNRKPWIQINAITISSSKFTHRAPDDALLLRVFVGGSRNPAVAELDDAPLLELARAELRDILGIQAEPLWSRIYRWPRSNPQYDVGHLAHIDALEALCPAGLYLAGSAYRGVGIPDCARQGKDAAAHVLAAYLERSAHTIF